MKKTDLNLKDVNTISFENLTKIKDFCLVFSFYENGKQVDTDFFPKGYLSIKKNGSMRFRYNENNPNREIFFKNFKNIISYQSEKKIIPIELCHSKTVYTLISGEESENLQGDGLITTNKNLIPSVTVADCVPIYLYDPKTQFFGIVHSGWKGTGICKTAIEQANKDFGTKASDVLAIIGPHIHSCCYNVDKSRGKYFADNFTPEAIKKIHNDSYSLSLAIANIWVLENAGVKPENILHCNACTCCNNIFGSFRRESVLTSTDGKLNFSDSLEPPRNFTPMAAFIAW